MERSALQEDLRLIESTGHGLVVATTARDFGVSEKVLRRLERNRSLMQLASGSYATSQAYESTTNWGQFDMRSRAWALSARNDSHAADFSAAAVLGLPMWGEPPSLPRLLRPGSAHRGHSRTPNGRIRDGWLLANHQWSSSGAPVTSAPYACIDVIRMGGRLQGLTVADYALPSVSRATNSGRSPTNFSATREWSRCIGYSPAPTAARKAPWNLPDD